MATLNNICSNFFDFKKLTLKDGCFRVEYLDKVLAELCCLQNMAYPLDSFSRVNVIIPAESTVELFDNQVVFIDAFSPAVYQINNPYPTRGFIACATYPCIDGTGGTLAESNKSVTAMITDKDGNISTVPFYMVFMSLANPQAQGGESIMNKLSIVNSNDFDVTINALLLNGSKTGVTASTNAGKC